MKKVCGVFLMEARDKDEARGYGYFAYYNHLRENVEKRFGKTFFYTTDMIKTGVSDGGLTEYDVVFTLILSDVEEMEEDTQEFYELERLLYTGISVIDED